MTTRSTTAPELTADDIGKFIDIDRLLEDDTRFLFRGRIEQVVHAVGCTTVRVQLWNDDSVEIRFTGDERQVLVD